ncbi:acetyl-CoA C-acyltransferase [Glutamicibacter soli]|uniref:Probable acetyl-CoA acetyltransferase n=1 Tax=Glutamicibacter soli TaxID=453836 RepID=A0A365YA75_9MICC|nr:thiolase family protein [Glutamicibacter soli]RBL99561.1 acetyl-CoA C-acyltransferase [Glutamicibacter soli]
MSTVLQQHKITILAGARTAVGRFNGMYRELDTAQLGAAAVRGALERSGLEPEAVDEVVMGCIGQVGPESYNARRVALGAGLPQSTTAFNVNRLCGSGLQAVFSAAQSLVVGANEVAVAGGNESMTGMPYLDYSAGQARSLAPRTLRHGTLAMLTDPFSNKHMGTTADAVARKYQVGRAAQDEFALRSQQLAGSQIARQAFAQEIIEHSLVGGQGRDVDEHPRQGVSLDSLAALTPAFSPEGTATAGNSSGVNDGAAALVLAKGEYVRAHGLPALATVEHVVVTAMDPAYMGYAPTFALRKLFAETKLGPKDIDVFELNEAFAAQALAVIRDAQLEPYKVNPYGGAIALGHPVGATGAILTLRAALDLRRRDLEYAVVTLCIGGGQGIAALLKRL